MKRKLKILVACEESQRVTIELRKLGHEAYSNDTMECSGGHPEWHIKGDCIKEAYSKKYDMMIAFPPCTYLSFAGIGAFKNKDRSPNLERYKKRDLALDFVRTLMKAPIDHIAIENPMGFIGTKIRKHDQIIHPYYFGDSFQKRTLLWLKNLPTLIPTNIVGKGEMRRKVRMSGVTKGDVRYMPVWYSKGGKERQKNRSKTFPGVAKAMATQWTKRLYKNQMLKL